MVINNNYFLIKMSKLINITVQVASTQYEEKPDFIEVKALHVG